MERDERHEDYFHVGIFPFYSHSKLYYLTRSVCAIYRETESRRDRLKSYSALIDEPGFVRSRKTWSSVHLLPFSLCAAGYGVYNLLLPGKRTCSERELQFQIFQPAVDGRLPRALLEIPVFFFSSRSPPPPSGTAIKTKRPSTARCSLLDSEEEEDGKVEVDTRKGERDKG